MRKLKLRKVSNLLKFTQIVGGQSWDSNPKLADSLHAVVLFCDFDMVSVWLTEIIPPIWGLGGEGQF